MKQQRSTQPNYGALTAAQARQKEKVLTSTEASHVRDISNAVIIKDENIFFAAAPDGNVPRGQHGLGLYYHDCRYLNEYEMKIAGQSLLALASNARYGSIATFQSTTPKISASGQTIEHDLLAIKWTRRIDSDDVCLCDTIEISNFSGKDLELPISMTFNSDFEDIFRVRGLTQESPGKLLSPQWRDCTLTFKYEGSDGVKRGLSICFSEQPESTNKSCASFKLSIKARETKTLGVTLSIIETSRNVLAWRNPRKARSAADLDRQQQKESRNWLSSCTNVDSDSLFMNRLIERSLEDLNVLQSEDHGTKYFSAGLPWFGTLFGRDSAISALQVLAFNPAIAEGTLRILARYQGKTFDPWRDGEPGKILHEYRRGELAGIDDIPHTPYYGSIDSTPLFLILLSRYVSWTGDLELFTELEQNVDLALDWLSIYSDDNGDGYIEYDSQTKERLINQGWKDSGNGIVDEKGGIPEPPISVIEVQAYAYMAKMEMAKLFEHSGDAARAKRLRRQCREFKARFNEDFWSEKRKFYAMGLDGKGRQLKVASSNPGHALWAEIVDRDKAAKTVARLMSPDLFSGWGIRTLSSKEAAYNPIGYHLGTVWPHENSMIAKGFRNYGYDKEALEIFEGITKAAMAFSHYRLPEAFAGYSCEDYDVPVPYPVACHPQAWAAAAVPYLLETLLGLNADALNDRLCITRPILPSFVDYIELKQLRVARCSVDLRFERSGKNAKVTVLKNPGKLKIEVKS